jgi:ribosomal protein S18 acetylase RimI-like enzyme
VADAGAAPVEVRQAGPEDLDQVAPLFDAYRQFYEQPADPALARAFIGERLARGESVVFLAEQGGRPVGFVQLYPLFSSTAARPRRLWLLNDLFVVPEARNAGVARALMLRARRLAEDTDAVGLELATAHDNLPAQRLYESLGWHRDLKFPRYELML